MSHAATRDRIITAAESLFAERGFAETSLRLITTKAGVNLAAVNYHFGSKKELIQAVFERFLSRLMAELADEMRHMKKSEKTPTVEEVLKLFMRPLQALDQIEPDGASIFMRLLGRAYAETQGHLRRFTFEHYGNVIGDLVGLLHEAYPTLPPSDVFWRLHFMMGTLVFAIGGNQALGEISAADYHEEVTLNDIVAKLIPFLAAGFKA